MVVGPGGRAQVLPDPDVDGVAAGAGLAGVELLLSPPVDDDESPEPLPDPVSLDEPLDVSLEEDPADSAVLVVEEDEDEPLRLSVL